MSSPPVVHDVERDLWIVSGRAEVCAVLGGWRQFSAATLGQDSFTLASPDGSAVLADEQTLLASDPPVHTRLRRLLVMPSDEQIEATVQPALRAALARVAARGRCELVTELCQPVVTAGLATVLGLGSRLEEVDRWIRVCSGCNAQSRPPWLRAAHEQMVAEVWWAAFCHAAPEVGLLLHLREVVGRAEIGPLQVIDLCITLMKGAADTVSHAVGNSLCALERDPELTAELRARPEQIGAFLEESLRRDAPVQLTMRCTTEAVELGGVAVPACARVLVLLGAANRDPAAFADPERLRIGRDRPRHVAFGAGPHRCPGARLARVTARAILRSLLELGDLRVDLASFAPVEAAALRGPQRLDLHFSNRVR